jgi:hypothetical protein
MGDVYLLHFSRPLAHARHYLGYAENSVDNRVERHRRGDGARITQVAVERGIEFELARTWGDVDRSFERRLKNGKNTPALCPICNPETARKNFAEGVH